MNDQGVLYRRSARILWRTVGDTVILAVPGRPDFEVLSGPSAAVWRLLDDPRTPASLVDGLSDVYEDADERMTEDVASLLDRLDELGLVAKEIA